ncbi:imidazole glycerol phosphate synthase subunit HisH [Candidatus Bathyarchaeota archaeon]|nr:MAG: imidazole glycerol phosphate synthase subunit HisH [Candidatus Bathyarchaeota archaeon]
MTRISVIDYGVGNLFSMQNALRKTGAMVEIVKTSSEILAADGVVLPGVGNFGAAALKLNPLADAVREAAGNGVPLLGSCLGMQLLFDGSEEGEGSGLGLLNGWIKEFSGELKTPHMGWNTIKATRDSPLLEGIPDGSYFYYVHSFYPEPVDAPDTLAETIYGERFTSLVERGNIYGAQFHPEKSGKSGAALLSNFLGIIRR